MSSRIVLNTEQVLSIASRLEADNAALQDLLNQSKSTIMGLSSVWTGSAAEQYSQAESSNTRLADAFE